MGFYGSNDPTNSVKALKEVPYFPDYKPRLFFKNFRVAAYIPVRLMCGRFQKNTTIHCTLRRAWISTWSGSTHPQYSTITDWFTDCLCSRVATPPPPAVSLSLSVCVCVDAAVYCTHRQSVGKRPPDVPCWARSSGPLTHAGLWPTHVTRLGLASLRRLSPTLLSPRLVFSGPRRSRLAALLPIFSSRVCIRGRTYVQGNNRRGCD